MLNLRDRLAQLKAGLTAAPAIDPEWAERLGRLRLESQWQG